jgi:hypothetical protein
MVYGYSNFDAPLGIAPPVAVARLATTSATPMSTSVATPAASP